MMTKRGSDRLHRYVLACVAAKDKRDGYTAELYRDGWTQGELAEALGVTQQEVSRRLARVHPTLW